MTSKHHLKRGQGNLLTIGSLKLLAIQPTYIHARQCKLAPRALKCVFIKYPEGVKGYKVWCTDLNPSKYIVSIDVVFNKSVLLKNSLTIKETNVNSKS